MKVKETILKTAWKSSFNEELAAAQAAQKGSAKVICWFVSIKNILSQLEYILRPKPLFFLCILFVFRAW